jgi:putative ubiquitin-RnfH superfamily antitoxin RatB of RatAB toxin-antitoxin module
MNDDLLKVEVVYASSDKQKTISIQVLHGVSVKEAIIASDIQQHFPEIDLSNITVGIYGKRTSLDTLVQDRDRIEIYRPLLANPKEVRRKRAAVKTKQES